MEAVWETEVRAVEKVKKCAVFLLILLLLGAGTVLAAWDLISGSVRILRDGRGNEVYSLVAADSGDGLYALGKDGKGYFLVRGDRSGGRTGRRRLDMTALPRQSIPASLYVDAEGQFYLALFDVDKDPAELALYRIGDGEPALLLTVPTAGDSLQAQMASVHITDFCPGNGDVLYFGVCQGDTARFYRTGAGSGLELVESVTRPGLRGGLIRSEGSWVLAAGEQVLWSDMEPAEVSGQIISHLTWANMGMYYLDEASMMMYCADFFIWQPYPYMDLTRDGMDYDLDDCTDLAIDRLGYVLLLMDGQRLLLDNGDTVTDLTGMLHRPAWQCGLILTGLAAGMLLAALILWYLVCEVRRLRLPLLVRWGVLMAAAAALAVTGIARLAVPAAARAEAERAARETVGVTVRLALKEDLSDLDLTRRISGSLSRVEGRTYRDARAAIFEQGRDSQWYLVSGSAGAAPGARGELYGGFDRELARQALDAGSAFGSIGTGDQLRFLYCFSQNGRVLTVDVDGAALLEEGRASTAWIVWALVGLAAFLTLLALVVLCRVTMGLRKVMGGMEALIAGEREVSVRQGGGDELTSLAEDLNALSQAIGAQEERQRQMEQSYRRFVPERVLSLLGKQSIAQVDKHTFASRKLAAMTFSFRFPDQVYASSGRELFDNVNEILERTASIVTEKGGAVFNFAYNGYDAVFQKGSAAAVSTAVAVQQEILEINAQRETEGRPLVSARIALDEGGIILGVVGDESQIEPTSISASFSAAKRLLELCGRLEASILCTETVAAAAEGYACRYMGKCAVGGTLLRIYEIFDGDPYEIRKFKGQTRETFSEGIYALYAGDFSRAKSIFLSLVHRGTSDGGARYYLYLADRLEKSPEETPSLDSGPVTER